MNTGLDSIDTNILSFKGILNGDRAFYDQPNYLETTRRELAENKTLRVSYTWNSENKIFRIVKQILSMIILPIGIYQFLHALVGKIVLPASSLSLMNYPKNYAHTSRSNISLNDQWKYKRMTFEVDGYKIDAIIMGTISTLNNGRWVLASYGNGHCYEDHLSYPYGFKRMLSKVNANTIVFNYPGVGASSGFPNRQAMAKAYRAILNFLEDGKNGIGAKEIIGYGCSIGGGVQGDALKTHELKKEIKYVFIKDRTFSDLSTIASILTIKPLGFLIKMLGWNIDSVTSSKKLQASEIIMQTARVERCEELKDSSKIINDDIISADASLAKALLDDPNCSKKNKVFIGMKEMHNDELNDASFLAEKIESLLNQN